jgi:hypothetical protein
MINNLVFIGELTTVHRLPNQPRLSLTSQKAQAFCCFIREESFNLESIVYVYVPVLFLYVSNELVEGLDFL